MEHFENSTAGADQLPADGEYTLRPPVSELYTPQKRDFQQAFPDLSPGRDTKRFCSHSPQHHATLELKNDDGALDNSSVTFDDIIAAGITNELCETEQARPHMLIDPALLEGTPAGESNALESETILTLPIDPALVQGTSKAENNTLEENVVESNTVHNLGDVEYLLEHSRREIRKYLDIIKQNTPDGQVDLTTVRILVGDAFNTAAAKELATSEQITAARSIFFPSGNGPIPPTRLEPSQTFLRGTTSSLSEPISVSTPSEPISLLPSPLSTFGIVPGAPCTAIDIKIQDKSTQTDLAPINTHNDMLDEPTNSHHNLSDNALWERELESIRRSQPLVVGPYTRVKVPLRETTAQLESSSHGVESSTPDVVKDSHNIISDPKGSPRRSLHSSAVASRNYGQKNHEVISVSDTDDDREGVNKFYSHLVGGGGLMYCEDGFKFVPSDGEGSTPGDRSAFEDPSNENSGTIDDLPDYEDTDAGENIGKEEGGYPIQPTFSKGRFDGNNTSDDDYNNADYQDEQPDRCALNYNDVMGSSSSRNRGRVNRAHTTGSYERSNAGRERSRSPDRHYSPRYRSNDSLPQGHREKLYDARHIYIKDGYPAQAHRRTSHDYTGQRYIRDEPQDLSFYGYSNGARVISKAKKELRYQDRLSDVGEIPGPKASLRLKLDEYVRDVGSDAVGLELAIKHITQETFYASETIDEEQALQEMANQTTKLYKGFPLVEEIGFVTVGNHAQPEGNCYWRALAHILHGKPARWNIIKADHLVYIQHVLSDKTHPRHQLYAKLNTQFFETSSGTLKHTMTPRFKANIWQLLHMPHSWTPGVMQQITADLYNIHLVTFAYNHSNNVCSEEFRYPRVTVAATARFPNAPKAGSKRVNHNIKHPWRNDWTSEVPPPVPRSHGCDLFQLSKLMGASTSTESILR
ncbi:hypothetical protein F5Y09DRAFT_356876 [Xylaria sp. FL1042]|nr:hypothetical protein F5Y09DRAFT_356876 [Xylaria sp. FL1042]